MRHRFFVIIVIAMGLAMFCATNAAALMTLTFGAKGGVTSATLHGNVSGLVDLSGLKILRDLKGSRTGFTAGLYANFRANPSFAIQIESMYTQKGGSGRSAIVVDSTTFTDADITIELDYVEFPVIAMVTFPANAIDFIAYGGAAIGFNLKSDAVITIAGSTNSVNIESAVKGTDWSAIAGLSISFGLGSFEMLLDGRFEYSLDSINNASSVDVRNGVGIFTIGLTTPIEL